MVLCAWAGNEDESRRDAKHAKERDGKVLAIPADKDATIQTMIFPAFLGFLFSCSAVMAVSVAAGGDRGRRSQGFGFRGQVKAVKPPARTARRLSLHKIQKMIFPAFLGFLLSCSAVMAVLLQPSTCNLTPSFHRWSFLLGCHGCSPATFNL